VTGRRGRRRHQLLDELKERRGYRKLKEEVEDRTLWRTCFGGDYGPAVSQTAECMKACVTGCCGHDNDISVSTKRKVSLESLAEFEVPQ
jgi:hypothetical protein